MRERDHYDNSVRLVPVSIINDTLRVALDSYVYKEKTGRYLINNLIRHYSRESTHYESLMPLRR